jgi:hypothetical protein
MDSPNLLNALLTVTTFSLAVTYIPSLQKHFVVGCTVTRVIFHQMSFLYEQILLFHNLLDQWSQI